MTTKTCRSLQVLSILLLLGGCGSLRRSEQPPEPVRVAPAPTGLYGAEEALRDALSGPWVHLGTGPWPGGGRMHACAFRNARVIVVNVYCGIEDVQAFRLEVYSPTRGRVRIYAESKAPVSAYVREQYFTFTAESEPPPPPHVLPPLDLGMSFSALHAYEEKRYAAYLPACYGGIERQVPRSGCLGPLESELGAFRQQNAAFLERASPDWYRVMRELRTLATRVGADPK